MLWIFHFPLSDKNLSGASIRERNNKSSYKIHEDSFVLSKFVIESIYGNKAKSEISSFLNQAVPNHTILKQNAQANELSHSLCGQI